MASDLETMQKAINSAMSKLIKFTDTEKQTEALKKKIAEVRTLAEELPDMSMVQMPVKISKYVAATKELEAMCDAL